MNEEDFLFNEHARELFESLDTTSGIRTSEVIDYERSYREFKKTGNGLFALMAFLQCSKYSLQAPDWISEWLVAGFTDYMSSQIRPNELSDLGKSLGVVTQTKKTQPKPFDKLDNKRLTSDLLYLTQLLHVTYGMTVRMAAEVVWYRQQTNSSWKIRPSSHQRLTQIYSEQGYSSKIFAPHDASSSEHASLLGTFVTPNISDDARQYLKDMIERFVKLGKMVGPDEPLPAIGFSRTKS